MSLSATILHFELGTVAFNLRLDTLPIRSFYHNTVRAHRRRLRPLTNRGNQQVDVFITFLQTSLTGLRFTPTFTNLALYVVYFQLVQYFIISCIFTLGISTVL